jgi:hypothetical protein
LVCLSGQSSTGKTLATKLALSTVTQVDNNDLETLGTTDGYLTARLAHFAGLVRAFNDIKTTKRSAAKTAKWLSQETRQQFALLCQQERPRQIDQQSILFANYRASQTRLTRTVSGYTDPAKQDGQERKRWLKLKGIGLKSGVEQIITK